MKIEFPNRDGHLLAGRLELPESGAPPHGFAVFAHCFTCSKDTAAASRVSRALAARGFGVLRFDFTGLGGSDGDFANTSFSSNVADLVAAAEWLTREHGAPQLLIGHSLGGAAVLRAAPRIDSVRAVATIGAPSEPGHVDHLFADRACDIRTDGKAEVSIAGRRFTIQREFLEDLAEHNLLAGLPDLGKATLIMHSPVDEIVGIDHARKLYQALRHPKSFVTLDDADHLLTRQRDALYVADVLAAWASRYLPERDEPAAAADAPEQGEVVVAERPDMRYAQLVRAGRHELTADEPESVGGADTGPDPYSYVLAGLGACTSMTLRMYAERKGWPLDHVEVDLRHAKVHASDCAECEGREGRVDRIERVVKIVGPGLDAEQRTRLLEIADRCPVHRTLEASPVIVTRAQE